jgi:hypothetical protein
VEAGAKPVTAQRLFLAESFANLTQDRHLLIGPLDPAPAVFSHA